MSSWGGNVRLALRTLRKAPGFTATTILLLGLGIGSVTTIFTLVDHVILRDLPYPDQDRLFVVENGSHQGPVFQEFLTLNSVDLWGAAWPGTANLVGEGDPLRVTDLRVSRDLFTLFGARPSLGRLLVADDFSAPDVVVLSYGFWERAFGGDPGIVGKVVRIDTRNQSESLVVVGVLEEGFLPPEGIVPAGTSLDLWRPLDWSDEALQRLTTRVLDVMGRMAPGVTLDDVNAELARASEILGERFPEDLLDRDGNPLELPAAGLKEVTTRRVRTGLGLLLGAVGLLLLVACMNVAHLFLARGLGRIRDMAVRRAVGAGTGNLVQQLLVESLVLGAAGGALGLGLAALGLRSFVSLNPRAIPWAGDLSLDLRILGFAAAVSGVTVLLFGLVPALRSMGQDLTDNLKGMSRGSTSTRGTSRLRNGLVITEVALSLVLVAGAGLLLKSFMNVQTLDPGFRVEGVWTLPLTPSGMESPEEYVRSMDLVVASLAQVPGVSSATYSLTLPFEMTGSGRCCWMTSRLTAGGEALDGFRLLLQPVTESYFDALGIRMVAGSVWAEADAGGEPWPTVVNEGLAIQLFGSAQSALNQVITVGSSDPSQHLITGVSGDTHHFGLDQAPPTFIYIPVEKLPFTIPMAHMAVSITNDAPSGWAHTLREAVWAAAPNMPVPTVRAMGEWADRSTSGRRFDSVLFAAFGGMALFLAGAGLYGTLLYTVSQRRRELGIRMALGAARIRVQRQVVTQGLTLSVLGCGIGLAGAWGAGRFLESRLFELGATDPGTLAAAVGILLAVAAFASWFPAQRASRVDPIQVLRDE